MTDPYRAMCAELVAAWDALPWEYDWLGNVTGIHCDRCDNSAVARARALLAQPVAEGPTNETPWEINDDDFLLFSPANAMASQAQKRSRRGRPTPQPVAVSERLPEPEDCTAQGWCWVFYRGFATWTLEPPLGQDGKHTGYTHWLPANALPTPEALDD